MGCTLRLTTMLALFLSAELASASGFSIDAASPSVSAGSNSAILAPGPTGGPPAVAVAPAVLGLTGGLADEIDAISFGAGSPGLTFHFSVTRSSAGLAGEVVAEALAGQAAGDVFATDLGGTNFLVANQRNLGLAPATDPGAPEAPPIDDLDALDLTYDGGSSLIVYALAPGHPLTGTGVGCGGDLFFAGALFIGYPVLGLASCLDDVDALEVDTPSNTFYYSLAPGSPSLLPGSPISGCATGCSPADLFSITAGAPAATRFASAAALGLLPSDDVDALSLAPAPPAIPALGTWGAVVLVGFLIATAIVSTHGARWLTHARSMRGAS